jgi:hypothetical protein
MYKPQKVLIHLCVKLSVFAISMATAGFLKFPSIKAIYIHAFKMAAVAMETTKSTNNLKCSELDETFQKFCLACVLIILRLKNIRMAPLPQQT